MLGEKAAHHLKRYTAELGGHAPVIVCADADPVPTARLAVAAKFRNAGQVCASPIRFLVQREVYARFRDEFLAATRALKLGSGFEAGVQLGPLIHERRLTAMREFVDDAVACGARLLCGGRRVERPGYFFEPTVLEATPPAARLQREAVRADRAARCVRRSGRRDRARQWPPLRPGRLRLFTRDLKLAHELGTRLQAGRVGINHVGVSQTETPYGGVKDSCQGSESGLEGLLAYTDVKLVSIGA
jgi:succinate-semialdehyde dehydrogenase/glutarate-semialdehyde dehydrogenase